VNSARRKHAFLLSLCALCAILFTGLGIWQVERRAWKLRLIADVEQRIHAPPRPAPGPAEWNGLSRDNAQYRRVRVHGTFLNDRETLVKAVTAYGEGYWIITPLETAWGTVLVNRGFVPPDRREPARRTQLAGKVAVEGLLRMSEPEGAFLRQNDPAHERWYSRDVEAIGRARRLGRVAPYFIDADARSGQGEWPIGGLTVVAFRNAHLEYALTWFALALLSIAGVTILTKRPRDW